jgi:hypothetical protein
LVLAETGTMMVSPPSCSSTRPNSISWFLTCWGLAPGLSILLMATMIGTSAALAWLMASRVWGITPSSAATTMTTMSVTLAPRARIAVKASWPGVSRKVMGLSLGVITEYAPMCWVMPPASPAATLAERMASRRLVLPWSTWPMMVTTGGRRRSEAGADSSSGR